MPSKPSVVPWPQSRLLGGKEMRAVQSRIAVVVLEQLLDQRMLFHLGLGCSVNRWKGALLVSHHPPFSWSLASSSAACPQLWRSMWEFGSQIGWKTGAIFLWDWFAEAAHAAAFQLLDLMTQVAEAHGVVGRGQTTTFGSSWPII